MTVELPNIYAQETVYEVLNDEKSESFFIEYNQHEYTFKTAPNTTTFTSDNAHATVHNAALSVDFSVDNALISKIRMGVPQISLKPYGVISAGAVFGQTALLGGKNGELKFVNYMNSHAPTKLDLQGHFVYTNLAQFFPSGKVGLSAGMDYTLKIWNLQTSELAQSMRHQKGLIDDVAMIGRGRNLLSLCRADESVVHWEVSQPLVVSEFKIQGALSMQLAGENIAFVGTKTNTQVLDLREKTLTELSKGPAEYVCAAQHFVARASGQKVYIHDARDASTAVREFECPVPVESMKSTQSKLYVKTEGSLYGIEYKSGEVEVLATDNKYLSVCGDELFTLDRDIRKFPL